MPVPAPRFKLITLAKAGPGVAEDPTLTRTLAQTTLGVPLVLLVDMTAFPDRGELMQRLDVLKTAINGVPDWSTGGTSP